MVGGRRSCTPPKRLAQDVKDGKLDPSAIDEEAFAGRLFTADIPDPDLVIRTSGEMRISNFLLWQSAYAEFAFPDVLWPDFSRRHLEQALDDFQGRERRWGGIG